ncbi:abortive phage infection protein [Bacillus sp. MUM 13]|uniref:abortive phage infection protein n=1 Tax=Bacillus sp. MUM 13 TaxID=1678001 RepID=UPI0008F578F0|nr:abortive phage infection protein [Bacillus sp. MUM 13]OIK14477.1 abortive phage infection protein [Bacillus sp. MUM 13]
MDKIQVHEILEKLASKEFENYRVSKEQFMDFRNVLVKRNDFKHFRGTAQHNGEVIYEYTENPRS